MIMESSWLNWVVEAISHEWTHIYLYFTPLGQQYEISGDMRTINETTADLTGKAIGAMVIRQYYPELVPPPPAPAPAVSSAPTPAPQPPAFDYSHEMYVTRVEADRLLAAGKIDEAEAYMEARRVFIMQHVADQGITIRRLNQAFFAFYGTYADTPGERGEDPVGPAVVKFYNQCPDGRRVPAHHFQSDKLPAVAGTRWRRWTMRLTQWTCLSSPAASSILRNRWRCFCRRTTRERARSSSAGWGRRGKRVVDPFGQSPALALELAREGAALLVAASNPVMRALIGLQADPPAPELIRSVLARLARSSPSASPEFLRPFRRNPGSPHPQLVHRNVRVLRQRNPRPRDSSGRRRRTRGAASPKAETESPELLDEPKKRKPQARLVRRICGCPACGHTVEEPITSADEARMPPSSSRRMLYNLALERLAPLDDWYRRSAAEALDVYPSRSIYALFLILTRLELMKLDPEEKRCADLLMLTVLDEAHMLRGHSHSARLRPRSLQPPPEYREVNVWRVLEQAAEDWCRPGPPVPVRKWRRGDELEAGTIATYAGNARDLAPALADLAPDFLISFLPRPNPAAWTLSAMWADWLWGRAAAGSLAGALHRRRYDWNWHARALTASAVALAAHLPDANPRGHADGRDGAGVLRRGAVGFLSGRIFLRRKSPALGYRMRAVAVVVARAGSHAGFPRAADASSRRSKWRGWPRAS